MYATYDSTIYSPVTSKRFGKLVPSWERKYSDHNSCQQDSNTKYKSVRVKLKSRIQAIKDKVVFLDGDRLFLALDARQP